MLEARKVSFWKSSYDITVDGQPLARWDGSLWRAGGTFELDGRSYEVRSNMWGSKYGMVDADGVPVASADRVGRRRWTVEAGGRTYEFRRPSLWREEEELHSQGQPLGSVKRKSIWRGDAVAHLPDVPTPVAVFILAVVLTMWDWNAAVAAG